MGSGWEGGSPTAGLPPVALGGSHPPAPATPPHPSAPLISTESEPRRHAQPPGRVASSPDPRQAQKWVKQGRQVPLGMRLEGSKEEDLRPPVGGSQRQPLVALLGEKEQALAWACGDSHPSRTFPSRENPAFCTL